MNAQVEKYAEIYAEQEANRVLGKRVGHLPDANYHFVKNFMKDEAVGVLSVLFPIIESDLLSSDDVD